MAAIGIDHLSRLWRLVAGFRALGLQTFLTAGPKETRAWEIKAGATAPEAAGPHPSRFMAFRRRYVAFVASNELGCRGYCSDRVGSSRMRPPANRSASITPIMSLASVTVGLSPPRP